MVQHGVVNMAEKRKLMWESPNKKWRIMIITKDSSPYVAMAYVTDDFSNHYAGIDENGRITTGLYNTYWEYTHPVPKTVEAKAFALLRKEYVEIHRKPTGKKTLPYSYIVIPWVNSREYKGVIPSKDFQSPQKYFRTYESAYKYARTVWDSYMATQKKYMYITIGRLSEPYDTIRDIPKNYRYSLAGEISKDNPPRKR